MIRYLSIPPTPISTSLIPSTCRKLQASYPSGQLVQFFISGISKGFCIGFKQMTKPLKSAKRNLDHPELSWSTWLIKLLSEELQVHFTNAPFPRHTSVDLRSAT